MPCTVSDPGSGRLCFPKSPLGRVQVSLWSGEGLSLVRIVAELPDFLSLCTVVIIVEPFLFVVSHSIIGEFIFQYYQKEEHSNSSALPASS